MRTVATEVVTSEILRRKLLKNGSIVKPYTGNMYVREILRNLIQSQRAGKAYYLYSETATYIRNRKGNKETIWKTRENT